MANEIRTRQNFVGGLIEDNPLTSGATTLTSASLGYMTAVTSTSHMPIILDPDGVFGEPEVAYVTAHSAGGITATIARGQEGTTARQHSRDTPWLHGTLTSDLQPTSLSSIPAIATGPWVVRGNASFVAGGAQLTPASASQTGMAWYLTPVKADGLILTWTGQIGVDGIAVYFHTTASDPTGGTTIGNSASVTWYTYASNTTPSGATGGYATCQASGGTQQSVDDSRLSLGSSNTTITNYYTATLKKLANGQYLIETTRSGMSYLRAIQPLPSDLVYLGFRGFTGGLYAAQSVTSFSGTQAV